MYTPILRCRQNELLALGELFPEAKEHCTPLLDLPAPSKKDDKASPETFTARSVGRIKKAVGGFGRVFVDSSELEPALRINGGAHPLGEACNTAAHAGAIPIPVTGLHRDASHLKVALKIRQTISDGSICIRLDPTDISTATLTCKRVLGWLSKEGIKTTETFLVLDLQSVFDQDAVPLANVVNHFLAQATKSQWAGLIVGGYGIPDELRNAVGVREQGYIPRTEQTVYQKVAATIPLGNLWFADYATLSPVHVDLDWRLLNKVMGPKALYALEDTWFVVRGGPFSTQEDGYEQYYDLAAEIVALEEFSGTEFSIGDSYIQARADRNPKPGSPGSWIRACVNHHISLTAFSHSA